MPISSQPGNLLLRSILMLCAWTAAVSGAFPLTSLALAQAPTDGPAWHFRYDLFQMLLEERGLKVLPALDPALAAPRDSLIVMVGSAPLQLSARDWTQLVDFVRGGGGLLIASDQTVDGPGFGQFLAGPVTDRTLALQYQGFEDCLQLPIEARQPAVLPGIQRVVSNRSGWFSPAQISWLTWETLVALPSSCQPIAARRQALLAVARSEADQPGIAIAAADASLLSNGMLWHGDNALAAIAISERLCGAGRTQFVFLADQQVLTSYRDQPAFQQKPSSVPPMDRPLAEPELDKALRLANAIAKEIIQSNAINAVLERQPRGLSARRYYRVLLAIFGLLCGIWFLRILLSRPLARFVAWRTRPMEAAFEIQNPLINTAVDFRQSAGYLAREFCIELTGSQRSVDWQTYLIQCAAKPVAKHKKSSRDKAEPIHQQLSRVIDIACRGCHNRMSREQFQALGNSIDRLRQKLCQPHLTE